MNKKKKSNKEGGGGGEKIDQAQTGAMNKKRVEKH